MDQPNGFVHDVFGCGFSRGEAVRTTLAAVAALAGAGAEVIVGMGVDIAGGGADSGALRGMGKCF